MSRVTDFDDVYAASRDRLLLQLYAYCGNADAADDALNEAFITASRHWHRIASLDSVDGWLRQRAVRRLDGRVRPAPASRAGPPSPQNARLLATLGALDAVSRRLLIVRRLDDVDLSTAAREVGLTDGAAEQALARASSVLRSNGVDTTPAGLQAGLASLRGDLTGVTAPPARSLRRAGARRRYAATGLLGLLLVAIAAGAGTLAASRPLASAPPATHRPTTTPSTVTTPASTPARLSGAYLLTADQVTGADNGPSWQPVAGSPTPTHRSVYGDCVQAADNPPPDSSWVRDLATARSRLRQVLQLAPSTVEAIRSYRQIIAGFALCGGHQLLDYSRVGVLGERAHLVRLLEPHAGGAVVENVVVSQSGPLVSFVSVRSPAGTPSPLSPTETVRLAGWAVNRVCSETASGCAFPPYTVSGQRPPPDETADHFLSVVDLPLVPGVSQPWVGTDPSRVATLPSATACDQTRFAGNAATGVTSRGYVIPRAPRLPTLFGLTETRGSFSDDQTAHRFVLGVARDVASCHQRQVTLSVGQSTSFTSHRTSGRVWEIRQKLSKKKVVTFRVALVRFGSTVAEVTFTPAGAYDVSQPEFVALAKRAAVRLAT